MFEELVSNTGCAKNRVFFIVLVSVTSLGWPSVAAEGPSFKRACIECAERELEKLSKLRTTQIVYTLGEFDRFMRVVRSRNATEQAIGLLDEGRKRWEKLSGELDKSLRQLADRAERDSLPRAISQFFSFVAASFNFVNQMHNTWSSQNASPQIELDRNTNIGNSEVGKIWKGQDRLENRFEYHQSVIVDGKKYQLQSTKIIQIFALPKGDSGNQFEQTIRAINDFLSSSSNSLRSYEAVPICYSDVRSCDIQMKSEEGGKAPLRNNSGRQPSYDKAQLYRTIKTLRRMGLLEEELKMGLSIALDLAPGIGEVKGIVEFISKKDPITGQSVSRWVSGPTLLLPFVGRRAKGGARIVTNFETLRRATRNMRYYFKSRVKYKLATKIGDQIDDALRAGKVRISFRKKVSFEDVQAGSVDWLCRGVKTCVPQYYVTKGNKGLAWMQPIENSRRKVLGKGEFVTIRRVRFQPEKLGKPGTPDYRIRYKVNFEKVNVPAKLKTQNETLRRWTQKKIRCGQQRSFRPLFWRITMRRLQYSGIVMIPVRLPKDGRGEYILLRMIGIRL